MKKVFLALLLMGCAFSASAQVADTLRTPSKGDLFDGMTRPLTFNRMIPPYAMEVTFNKTVHVIFPSPIRYVVAPEEPKFKQL